MPQAASPAGAVAAIAAAEAVLGIAYTAAERELAAPRLARQRALADAVRALRLDNGIEPATRFDPRLPGFAMPAPGTLVLPADDAPLPADDAAIAFAPATRQARWLRKRVLSARRLLEIYLARIARIDPILLAFARRAPAARARADALDAMAASGRFAGPLHGLPYACKDIIDTAGLVTDWGAETHLGRRPDRDAVAVARLAAAGAVLIGKSSVGALAYGDLWHGGRTRNPWNPDEGASGSSAGSASAVAAGLCAFALGTETYGSIVAPATRCGAVGLRPSFGRVARTGTMALCPSLDKIGPIARSVADTALVLDAINGADDGDAASIAAPFGGDLLGADGLRIGYVAADFAAEGSLMQDRAMLDTCRDLGFTLVPKQREDLPYDSLVSILMAEAAASFETLTGDDRDDLLARQDAEAWPNQFRAARFLSAVDHVQLDRLRRRAMLAMARLFEGVDVLIGPSQAGPMQLITNMTGHPCLCLPSGFVERGGARVPHAIALWGRLFDEGTLLAAGGALAAHLGLDLRPTPMRGPAVAGAS